MRSVHQVHYDLLFNIFSCLPKLQELLDPLEAGPTGVGVVATKVSLGHLPDAVDDVTFHTFQANTKTCRVCPDPTLRYCAIVVTRAEG